MTDQIYPHDMAVEAKLCAMIVTNPGGSPRPQAWKQRVNELIRAQTKAIADLRADCDTLKDGRDQQEMTIQQLKRERDAALAQNRALEEAVSVHQTYLTSDTETTVAARDVLAERARQVSKEGWMPEHDDTHRNGELASAASTYALHSTGKYGTRALTWPWHYSWWKPSNPRRDLVKAGALILAEIERLDRAAAAAMKGGAT